MRVNVKMYERIHVKLLAEGNLQRKDSGWICAVKDTANFERSGKILEEVIDNFTQKSKKMDGLNFSITHFGSVMK